MGILAPDLQNKATLTYKTEGEWCNAYITNGKRPVLVSSVRIRAREASMDIQLTFDRLNNYIRELVQNGSYISLHAQAIDLNQSESPILPNDPDHEQEYRTGLTEDNPE